MKHCIGVLVFLCVVAGAADAQDNITPITVPSWGGLELQGLTVENDFRELDVAVPLPALPYMPKMSFHRYAYETKGRFGGWQKGGARVLKAYLPFGLELEAGHRLDRFGHRESEFVGLTFTYSHLQDHHENWHYGRLGADRGAPMPEHIGTDRGKVSFWQLARPIFLGAAMALALDADSETTVTGSDSGGQLPGDNGGGGSGSSGSGSGPDADGWELIWFDEFSESTLDTNKWSTADSYGRSMCNGGENNEQQCYTSSPQNVSFSGGNLILTARLASGVLDQGRTYTSGRIQSNGKGDFTYGKFEASIKLPTGQGSWPAFWMLPSRNSVDWPSRGEIDIMEAVNLGGSGGRTIHGTAHWGDPHTYLGGSDLLSDINDFHTYTVEWYPDEIRWFLNGDEYYRLTQNQWFSSDASDDPNAPFDQDFHLILNFAVGGNWPGASDGSNFPRQMEVDYVRVYECAEGPSACK